MIFFKLKEDVPLTWNYFKEDLQEDFKSLKAIIANADDHFLNGTLYSGNASEKENIENEFKRGFALSQGIKDMLVRIEVLNLDSFDEEYNKELEYAKRKINTVYEILTNMAMKIGRVTWDGLYKESVVDIPLKELDEKVKKDIQEAGNDEQKKNNIVYRAETEKQRIIDGAMAQRENFAQGYLNILLQQGMELFNKKLFSEEVLDGEKSNTKTEENK